MPAILGFADPDGASFVRKIEQRSSLLSHVGHEVAGGEIVGVYEFKHLTFQECLAARAIVKGHHAGDGGRVRHDPRHARGRSRSASRTPYARTLHLARRLAVRDAPDRSR
jgi:hypothetical protein